MMNNKKQNSKGSNFTPVIINTGQPQTLKVSKASSRTVRRNRAATIQRTNQFINIENGITPFRYSSTGSSQSNIDARYVIEICQKAYYNFWEFRGAIDLMSEFSSNNIYLTGGTKKSREIFESLFRKINLWNFQDQFFREYYRSGNVIIFRYDSELRDEDITKMRQTYGAAARTLPARYVILNPIDLQVSGNISFVSPVFRKILSGYELERLRSPKTDEDKDVFDSLSEQTKKLLKNKASGQVVIDLPTSKIHAVFYKKQDYEPLAIPMGYPVLADINWKQEMKQMDMAVCRTMQQAILLITMGDKDNGVDQANLEKIQELFDNESVGRVLVSDYTTKAEFVIPDIAQIIDPKKYEVVNEDIRLGLNQLLIGDEKFANSQIKVKVFVERLKHAREAFLNDFLMPEIKRISKSLGFKTFPTPHFEDIDLKDGTQFARVYNRLTEIGVLTPEEGITALNTGRLPTPEESVESQKRFQELRKQNLYKPLLNGSDESSDGGNGRPSGTTRPESTKKVSPIGENNAYSLSLIKENLIAAQNLEKLVTRVLKKEKNVTRISKKNKSYINAVTGIIMANEDVNGWSQEEVATSYFKMPTDKNKDRVREIDDIACFHQINSYMASILKHSVIQKPEEND